MTIAENRAACIEAQTDAFIQQWFGHKIAHRLREEVKQAITAAFDSLNGLARVNPINPTVEMIIAGREAATKSKVGEACIDSYRAMAAAGDLTNPPDTDAQIAMSRRGGPSGASLDEMAEKYNLTKPPEKKP